MEINIEIDRRLMTEALKVAGVTTRQEAVERGLRLLIKRNQQQAIRALRGKLHWQGET